MERDFGIDDLPVVPAWEGAGGGGFLFLLESRTDSRFEHCD